MQINRRHFAGACLLLQQDLLGQHLFLHLLLLERLQGLILQSTQNLPHCSPSSKHQSLM